MLKEATVDSDASALDLFRKHGAIDDIERVATDSPDEAIFVVSSKDVLRTRVRDLTEELQALLRRKVWVTTESGMFGRTVKLGVPAEDEEGRH